ncbi:MAG: helix-turn-helix transcriptional regulator [Oscillospiraceae bacterium]
MYFKRLEDLRTDNDFTQKFVAEKLNMGREVYWRYEKGTREIPVWALIKLSELYGVSTDYLLGLTNTPERHA